jgi:signal transduction histidine kinase/ligand-binding sensor domain-containing protein/DNA-binding NarL/FixJ family response regulator/HPt (histidine-containing phosphotransfer) domain-containing protein
MKVQITVLFIFIGIICSFAQNQLRFDRITIEDGLSHTTVHSIFQNKDGLIWIGTEDGLNIYNGYTFKTYKFHAKNPYSISSNVIKSIFRDKKGTVWIGTENGLNRYIPEKDGFISFKKEENNPEGLTDNHIRKIVADQKGNLWLATNNGVTQVVDYTDTSIQCIQYPYDVDASNTVNYPVVRGIFVDSKDRVWIGTDGGGVYKIINTNSTNSSQPQKFIQYKANSNNVNAITSNRINGFAEDKYGNIWISTWKGGVNKLYIDENGDEKIIAYRHDENDKTSINYDKVTTIFADTRGYIWLGTYNKGVNRAKISPNSNSLAFDSFKNEKDNEYSLSHNTTYTFFEDKTGEIWLGTWGNGISKVGNHSNRMLLFGFQNGFKDKAFNEIWSIDTDENNNWWIGAWDGGITRITPNGEGSVLSYDKKIKHFKHEPNNPNSISDNKVTSILHDSKDRLWATTWGNYINVAFDVSKKDNLQFKKIKVGDSAYFVYEDKKGLIWVGTRNGLYLIQNSQLADFSTNVVESSVYRAVDDNPRSLPTDRVRTMLEDSKGNVWIGTANGGLAVAKRSTFDEFSNADEMVFDTYQASESDLEGLSHNYILAMYESKDGNIWIGSLGGLDKYNPETNTFTHYNENTGHLKNNIVSGIIEDEANNLWITTERGVVELNTSTEKTRFFTPEDGLQGNIFTTGAIHKDIYGNFLMGGRNGLNAFNPKQMQPNPNKPSVILTDFKILNQSITTTDHPLLENTSLSELKDITILYHENMITFEFAALNYTIPEHNQYQYKLENFDNDWVYIKNNRTATYTNLNPGTYTFLVRGSNNDGVWNEEPLKIALRISPPFWMTWWFRLLALILTIGSISIFIYQRFQKTKKQNIYLEKVVEERTKEIQKQKQLVEERSRFKEQFFSNVSHELRTPLNGIIGLSHLMERTKLSDVQRQFTNVIQDSSENLLVIINDLLDISKINAGKLQLNNQPFETARFFNSLYELLRPKADQKGIELHFSIDENLPEHLTGDSVRLYQILINLLGNALKFIVEGNVTLIVKSISDDVNNYQVGFEVLDTGIGIEQEKIENIFKSYEQIVDEKGYHYEGTGLGLTIVKNLVDLQKGTIEVESQVNVGTTFKVILPFVIPTEEAIKEGLQKKQKVDFGRKWKDKEILLIEDNQVNLLYTKNLFIQWNLNVTIAKTISQSIKMLTMARYDVIISDVKLPDGNGIDLIRGLQKDSRHVNKNTPVIVLSGNASLSGARPNDIKVVSYMTKPFKPNKLAEILSKLFNESIGMPSASPDNSFHSSTNTGYKSEYLAHLCQLMNGNPKHILTMLDVFLKQLPQSVQELDDAIITENWEQVNYIAHTIKSTILTIGIDPLSHIVREIEAASEVENPNLIQLLNLFEDFKQRSEQEIPRLKEERQRAYLAIVD